MNMLLDVNIELYPLEERDKITVALVRAWSAAWTAEAAL